jgi:hypothetical protein
MLKAVIWFLFGVGFLVFFGGLIVGEIAPTIIGLLMMAGGVYLGIGPPGILRKENVLETWAILIEGGEGKSEEVFRDTEGFITASKVPSVAMERRQISPGIVRGAFGVKREFLIITDKENFRLEPYKFFFNARDYGINLDVSWHLTYRPTWWQALMSLIPFVTVIPEKLSDLDIFDEQDLRAYTTNSHRCVNKAVEKLILALHQDPSKIDRRSRGFLGIS